MLILYVKKLSNYYTFNLYNIFVDADILISTNKK